MELYTFHRSIAAHRVRIVLNYKGLPHTSRFVKLDATGSEPVSYRFRALNPQGLAPVLVDNGEVITQSLAIMEYLEERSPARPMLPPDGVGRARARSLAQLFACDIQPLNNLRVQRFLRERFGCDDEKIGDWYRQWVMEGLEAAEMMLAEQAQDSTFCCGDKPTFADACLVPQVHDAMERGYDLSIFPTVRRIYRTCMTLASFQAAAPETQPDADREAPPVLHHQAG